MHTRKLLLPLLLTLSLCSILLGCAPLEQNARDTIAAAKGLLVTAQAQYHDQCVQAPTNPPCVTINRAIAAQHLAIDTLNIYCQFMPSDPPEKACIPVKAARSALISAIANLNGLNEDIRKVIK